MNNEISALQRFAQAYKNLEHAYKLFGSCKCGLEYVRFFERRYFSAYDIIVSNLK